MSLAAAAVRRPVATSMACIGVVLLGLVSYGGLSVDLLPDVSTPRITLMTRAEGLSPLEVERLVTQRLESAVAAVPGLERTTSVSREGMSVITLSFPWGIDLDLAALHVREKIDGAANSISQQAERPAVLRWDPGSEPVMGVAVAGSGSLGDLRELVETVVVTRLEQVAGIAGGQVTGGAEREVQVRLDPEELTTYGLTVTDVMRAIERSNLSSRSGSVLQGTFRYQVQVLGEFATVNDIAGVPVNRGPRSTLLTVGDLGEVFEGTRPRLAGALLDGRPAVGVLLYKESGVNTIEAVEAAEVALGELRDEYPELTLEVAFENASFIREAIDSVVQNILIGGILAFAVLFLFLKDPRNPVLLGVSIPVSLIATFVLCYFTGISLNIMTLGGLALGVGMLVDNSIVVLENIYRHRQLGAGPEAAARRGTDEVAMAVSAATLTTIAVFLPIAYVHGVAGELFSPQAWTVTFALLASLVVSLTVLPMLAARFLRFGDFAGEVLAGTAAVPGDAPSSAGTSSTASGEASEETSRQEGDGPYETNAGRDRRASSETGDGDPGTGIGDRQRPRGRAVSDALEGATRAVMGAVGKALTALAALPLFWIRGLGWLLRLVLAPVVAGFGRVYDAVEHLYHVTLDWCLRHRTITALGALLLIVLGARLALSMPFELMPPVNAGRFDVTLDAPPGTPFEDLEGMVARLDETARSEEGVATTFATLGLETSTSPGAASGVMALSPTRAFLTVVMEGERSRSGAERMDAVMAAVRREAATMERATLTIDPQRSPLERLLGAEASGFRIALRGDDLDVLDRLADEAATLLRPVEGLEDVVAHNTRGNPEIRLRVRREAARRYGVDVQEVTDAMVGALQGRIADTQFVEFDRRVDIRVSARGEIEGLEEVLDRPYPTENGQVPLRELVDQTVAAGPTEVVRTDRVREVPITATLSGVALSEAVEAAEAALVDLELPAGYRYQVAGERQEVDASFRSLGWAVALAALLVYMVMAAQFESLVHPFVILLSLPLGWVGVVLALWALDISINVVALIGAVVLTGIIVNDAIVKVDTINRLRREKGYDRRRAVVEGSGLRLRPILMTSVTTTCALIPMALGLGAGAELQRPLAIAVIGGESTGTLLTLVVIPVFYELLDRQKRTSDEAVAGARAARPAVWLAAAAILASLACGSGDPSRKESSAWRAERTSEGDVTTIRTLSGSSWGGAARLIEEASIGVDLGEDPYMFGRVADLAATDGVIYVLDSDIPVLRAYDMEGVHLRDIGAAGQGPGEYERPGAVGVAPDGTVVVHDDGSDRITLYTPDGEPVETWPGRQDGFRLFGAPMVVTHDGVVYTQGRIDLDEPEGGGAVAISTDGPRWAMFPRGPDGTAGEPIAVPDLDHDEPLLRVEITTADTHMVMGQSIPFVPGVSWTLSPSGAMVAGVGDDYRFEIRYPDGTRTVVEKVWQPFPVSPEEAEWNTRRLTALLRERDPDWTWEGPRIPARRPAYEALYADRSNRVWVKRTGPAVHRPDCDPDPLADPGAGPPCWSSEALIEVFDLEGAYLGRVEWPEEVVLDRSTWIRGDRVLARGEDEAGTVRVKRYRLVRPGDDGP